MGKTVLTPDLAPDLTFSLVGEPAQPHETMQIGLPDLRDPKCLDLRWMLISPLRKDKVLPLPTAAQIRAETPS